MSLLENATRAVICMHLCLCKTLSQDCPHGEIKHVLLKKLYDIIKRMIVKFTNHSKYLLKSPINASNDSEKESSVVHNSFGLTSKGKR